MDKIDIAIIGGGVIGLAVASEAAERGKDIYIFEKNTLFGQEASSRNSEVIHSGIYYPENSLKKKTCIEGNRLLYEICTDNNIPHSKIGKLIVAQNQLEMGALEDLFRQGRKNGLENIKMLSVDEVRKLEPNVRALSAIYLPMTGIIDSHSLMEYFLFRAKSKGSDIIYGTEVKCIDKVSGGYRISAVGKDKEGYIFWSKIVINCAGLNSDLVAKSAGIENGDYTLSYCKGDYFRIGNKKNFLVKRLVYPVVRPPSSGLGIHFTPDLAGGARLGPDAEYLPSREINYDVDPGKKDIFYENVKSFLPFLEKEDLSVDTAGIRAKLQGPGEGFRDFVIKHEAESGLPGFINLIGIESPGLTASPAIARMVKRIMEEVF